MAVKILQHDKDEISWYHSVGIMIKKGGRYNFGYLTRNKKYICSRTPSVIWKWRIYETCDYFIN